MPAPKLSVDASLDTFYGFFPDIAGLPESLDKVYAAAAHQGVLLEQGEYRLINDRDGKFRHYQVTLPVKAAYPKVRSFVEEVLRELPSAALDQVSLKRESVAANVVEAQVKFTLFMRGGQ
jgi:hypothetical protein